MERTDAENGVVEPEVDVEGEGRVEGEERVEGTEMNDVVREEPNIATNSDHENDLDDDSDYEREMRHRSTLDMDVPSLGSYTPGARGRLEDETESPQLDFEDSLDMQTSSNKRRRSSGESEESGEIDGVLYKKMKNVVNKQKEKEAEDRQQAKQRRQRESANALERLRTNTLNDTSKTAFTLPDATMRGILHVKKHVDNDSERTVQINMQPGCLEIAEISASRVVFMFSKIYTEVNLPKGPMSIRFPYENVLDFLSISKLFGSSSYAFGDQMLIEQITASKNSPRMSVTLLDTTESDFPYDHFMKNISESYIVNLDDIRQHIHVTKKYQSEVSLRVSKDEEQMLIRYTNSTSSTLEMYYALEKVDISELFTCSANTLTARDMDEAEFGDERRYSAKYFTNIVQYLNFNQPVIFSFSKGVLIVSTRLDTEKSFFHMIMAPLHDDD